MKYILPIYPETGAWYRMDENYFKPDYNYKAYVLKNTSGKFYHDVMCAVDVFEFDNIDDFNFAKRLQKRLEEPERLTRTMHIMYEDPEEDKKQGADKMIKHSKKRYIINAILIGVLLIVAYLPSGEGCIISDEHMKILCWVFFFVFELINVVSYKLGIKL
jgi:hypothetical protein